MRVVRFYVRCTAPLASCPSSSPSSCPSSSSFLCPSSPDLICQLLIAVGLAGSHLPALDRSGPDLNRRESERCGPRWTSTGDIRSAVGLAGPQPARFGRCGPRRTSTGEIRSTRRTSTGEILHAPDLNGTSTARKKAV